MLVPGFLDISGREQNQIDFSTPLPLEEELRKEGLSDYRSKS